MFKNIKKEDKNTHEGQNVKEEGKNNKCVSMRKKKFDREIENTFLKVWYRLKYLKRSGCESVDCIS